MILALLFLCQLALAAPQPIKVPDGYRTCTTTSECEAVPLRCGCCQYQGISKIYVTTYLDQNHDPGCVDQPCRCQPFKLVPRCANSRCELVDSHASPRAPKRPKTKRKKTKKTKKKKPALPKHAGLPASP